MKLPLARRSTTVIGKVITLQKKAPVVYLLFVVGFFLLIKGASWLVDGSAALARRYRVSDMFIGLTIVSVGTSFPELVVNLAASLSGSPEIAIGNIFGSNIANVLLVLGLMAVIYPVAVQKNTLRFDIPVVLAATLLVSLLGTWGMLFSSSTGEVHDYFSLSRLNGVILLVLFGVFLLYSYKQMEHNKAPTLFGGALATKQLTTPVSGTADLPLWRFVGLIIIGIAALYLGGDWVVKGAVVIAENLGLSEGFVGLTIVAFGTSLPELVTSVMAASKRNVDMAFGNIIGSNVFNLLWVIGISAVVNPLRINMDHINRFDILVMLLSSALIIPLVLMSRKRTIGWPAGVLFLLLYAGYLVALINRG